MNSENNSSYSCKKDVITPLILGGSKGLGRSIHELLGGQVCSRTAGERVDFSKSGAVDKILKLVDAHKPSHIFYCAGGGPHGDFLSKPLHSHEWAFKINQFMPLSLANSLKLSGYKGEFVYIGSAIAERSNSLESLSYSFSKKVTKKELLNFKNEELKVKVFSPPYMDTGLLPLKSWPREECPNLVLNPQKVAEVLISWLKEKKSEKNWDSDARHFDWMERFTYDVPNGKEL